MFHRVKSENQQENQLGNKGKNPTTQLKDQPTISPNASVRMAQNTAVTAAQKTAAPAEKKAETLNPTQPASVIARQAYIQKQANIGVNTTQPITQPKVAQPKAETTIKPTNIPAEKEKTMTTQAPETQAAAPQQTKSYGNKTYSYTGATGNDSRLTIGQGITMSGEIENCEHLLVEGTVEAALRGANILEISETGVFYGTVEIQEAEIAGRFEGDLTAYDRLVVKAGGTITGTISYREIEVEAGATIEGTLNPLPREAATQTRPDTRPEAPKAKEVRVAEPTNLQPANTDQDLFANKASS